MSSSVENRRVKVGEIIVSEEEVKISDLSRLLHTSEISIRRDLIELEKVGLLRRTRGGATATIKLVQEQSFREKVNKNLEKKQRIAREAVKMIQKQDTIILDSGTTVLQIAPIIKDYQELTVVTHSLPVVEELKVCSRINLTLVGGIYNPNDQSLMGPLTVKNISQFYVKKCFVGVDGLSISRGLTTTTILKAEVVQAIIKVSRQVIVVADSSKIGQVGFTSIAPLTKIDKLITDRASSASFIQELRHKGIEVILV